MTLTPISPSASPVSGNCGWVVDVGAGLDDGWSVDAGLDGPVVGSGSVVGSGLVGSGVVVALGVGSLLLAATGAGRFSLDRLLGG